MTGRVIRARGRLFTVLAEGREYQCEVLKKAKREERVTPVAVGDLVDFNFNSPGPGGIEKVHPRTTKFSRPRVGLEAAAVEQVIAANIDQMVVVVSVAQPQFRRYLIDRFAVAAAKGGLKPALVVNKIDLNHSLDLKRIRQIYESIAIPVIFSSCKTEIGVDKLREQLRDHESILVGHSGVGKSSLLNLLQPGLALKTRRISAASGKGKHATTAVELYPLDFGGYVVDTPGLKILGLWELEAEELQYHFPEFQPYLGKCRFSRCSHTHEPECAVKQAVNEGEICEERYQSYVRMYNDL
ncbi:MAG: ribosome small subunit-dependent GTPase A [candidate division Zixibacteria bacterium]|nr:ribosome small subunit-dependent GTPase A [candidate division Zixibacteria bacterium]